MPSDKFLLIDPPFMYALSVPFVFVIPAFWILWLPFHLGVGVIRAVSVSACSTMVTYHLKTSIRAWAACLLVPNWY